MKRRASGILLHITSLPSSFGIGDLGNGAYRFADFLAESKQSLWQVLPLNPTNLSFGNSPYASPSAFAGNPLLVSLELLMEEGLLSRSDLKNVPSFPEKRVDYSAVTDTKEKVMVTAHRNFRRSDDHHEFDRFCREHAYWLEDYALFVALKDHYKGMDWSGWPTEIRDRQAVEGLKEEFGEQIHKEKFFQYLFFKQWRSLKNHCRRKGIQIIGDFPLYVVYDSADVWGNPRFFQLGPDKKPTAVAGVPPDYFSTTGQLWGNPLYDWDALKRESYSWWVERVTHNLKIFDVVRLDHFKGFAEYWAVPSGEATAIHGTWMKGPGADLFNVLLKHLPYLPLIAEDLGVITADVQALRDRFDLPGMRVLQFAFGNDPLGDEYKPHNYIRNCVAYTGTHDNDTLLGWITGDAGHSTRKPEEVASEKRTALNYIGIGGSRTKDTHWEFIRLMLMTVANTVIIPMQDILGLGNVARMNRPATAGGNWEWRLSPGQLTPDLSRRLKELTVRYGRE